MTVEWFRVAASELIAEATSNSTLDELRDVLERARQPEPPVSTTAPLEMPGEARRGLVSLEGPELSAGSATSEERIFRRELPVRTTQLPGSVPAWAAGASVARTLGPFVDGVGRRFWFDVYQFTRRAQVVVKRGESALFSAPLRRSLSSAPVEVVEVAAGSVWLSAPALAPSAPAGSFCGIRVAGGQLSISPAATWDGDRLLVPAGAEVRLAVQLDPLSGGPSLTPLAPDAAAVKAAFPGTVTFTFRPANAAIAAAPASVEVYGTRLALERKGAAPFHDNQLNRLCVPLTCDQASFAVTGAGSDVFQLQGKAPVTATEWALSTAVIDPAAPGLASGTGAFVIRTGPGLHATWQGLKSPKPLAGKASVLMAEPRRLVVSMERVGANAHHELQLWNERGAERRNQVNVSFRTEGIIRYWSEQDVSEMLLAGGDGMARLDRPVAADGQRLRLDRLSAVLAVVRDGSGQRVVLSATRPRGETLAVGLNNALLKVEEANLLFLQGTSGDGIDVTAGAFLMGLPLWGYVPMLPDPYAADSSSFAAQLRERKGGSLVVARVDWASPPMAKLSFVSGPLRPVQSQRPLVQPVGAMDATRAQSGQSALRKLFEAQTGPGREAFGLLDVSGNAGQLGVAVAQGDGAPALTLSGLSLVAPLRNVRALAMPQVAWEPVQSPINPSLPFPELLRSRDDGGPLLMGVNSVELVPVSPLPAVDQLLAAVASGRPGAALMTLPFGIKAVSKLGPPAVGLAPTLGVIRPAFAGSTGERKGTIQLRASARRRRTVSETESFEGIAVQTRNAVSSTAPGSWSVLSDATNPAASVETLFNGDFAGAIARVPLKSIDFSGYGASCFSEFRNPDAVAQASQVRFDVWVGRTAYEVVQVQSFVYPWAFAVVRTITLQRTAAGSVLRRDSGWVAAGDGQFDFGAIGHDPAVLPPVPPRANPGVIRALRNIRNLRITERNAGPPGTLLGAVYFDADVEMERVVSGAGPTGLVGASGLLGFVQILPTGRGLSDEELDALLLAESAIGGPIECTVDVGGSGQAFRVQRIEVGRTENASGGKEVVGVARGSPVLSKAGNWTVVRTGADLQPGAIDERRGVPLVSARGSAITRLAEPEDLFQSDDGWEYGLVQAGPAHRVLFPRPTVATGEPRWKSRPPVIADLYALIGGEGAFPPLSGWLQVPIAEGELEVLPGSELRLPSTYDFSLPAGTTRTVWEAAGSRQHVRYRDGAGAATRVKLAIDPQAAPTWKFEMSNSQLSNDLAGFIDLMYLEGPLSSASGAPVSLGNPEMKFGTALGPVSDVLNFLKGLGSPAPLPVELTNASYSKTKFKAALKIYIADSPRTSDDGKLVMIPPIDLGIGKLSGAVKVGFASYTKTKDGKDSSGHSAFFEVEGELEVKAYPPFAVGGLLRFGIEADSKDGNTYELVVAITGSVEGKLGPIIKVSGKVWVGILLAYIDAPAPEPDAFELGLILGVGAEAKLLEGLLAVAFEAEGVAGFRFGTPNEAFARLTVGLSVTICWFITISVEWEGEAACKL